MRFISGLEKFVLVIKDCIHGDDQGVLPLFNGINKPMPSMGLTLLRMFGLYVPLAWLASVYWNLQGVFWSAFVANILVGAITYIWLKRHLRKKHSALQSV